MQYLPENPNAAFDFTSLSPLATVSSKIRAFAILCSSRPHAQLCLIDWVVPIQLIESADSLAVLGRNAKSKQVDLFVPWASIVWCGCKDIA